ncbi:hypothetical protein V1478_001111 [Vespula squamosa]|uniref:Uncharacterized protein n=1 Tax=Vespula squamosa TaxID=30214 RepID=A0ABD2C7F3_VESSQ
MKRLAGFNNVSQFQQRLLRKIRSEFTPTDIREIERSNDDQMINSTIMDYYHVANEFSADRGKINRAYIVHLAQLSYRKISERSNGAYISGGIGFRLCAKLAGEIGTKVRLRLADVLLPMTKNVPNSEVALNVVHARMLSRFTKRGKPTDTDRSMDQIKIYQSGKLYASEKNTFLMVDPNDYLDIVQVDGQIFDVSTGGINREPPNPQSVIGDRKHGTLPFSPCPRLVHVTSSIPEDKLNYVVDLPSGSPKRRKCSVVAC